MAGPRKLRVFLCHASQDKPVARELYQKLSAEGWIEPWLDEENLLPGQAWDLEIEKAVETADAVIVCLSHHSVTKEGYVQKEFRKIVEIALEKPEETIFVLPMRLDACDLPRQLRARQSVDYFPPEQRAQTYQRLLQSLKIRFGQLEPFKDSAPMVDQETGGGEEGKPRKQDLGKRLVGLLASKGTGTVDTGGSIPLILYFLLAALYILTPSDSTNQSLVGIFGVLAGSLLVIRKQLPATILFRISAIVYLALHGFNEYSEMDIATIFEGIAALILCGLCVVTVRTPKKPVFYSSLAFALFLFLAGVREIMASFDYYPSFIGAPIAVTSIIAAILLLGDL
jgi:hypothetical protein